MRDPWRRRPQRTRMARLRNMVYVVLVLCSHIDVSNTMMQEQRPKGQGEWRKPDVSNLEVNSKTGISRQEIRSKGAIQSPGVNSKAFISHSDVNTKADVSYTEVRAKGAIARQKVHSKAGVSSQEGHSKADISRPKLLRLDWHSQLEQTGRGLSVKDCPSQCRCVLIYQGDQTVLAVLNCESDPIDALPKLFDSHRNVTQVQIINCSLSRMPIEITKLPSLVVVALTMNEFTEVPQQALEVPQLLELYMEHNLLTIVPADVTKCSVLQTLDLTFNRISKLPQEIGGMQHLMRLNLTYNKLESLPQSIGSLSHLVVVDISYNKLRSLPSEIGNLTTLIGLFLSNNQLRLLPSEVGNLRSLRGLYLSYNLINTLPHEIGGMSMLSILELQVNELTMLPYEITELKQLTSLDLSDSSLGKIPALPTENLGEFFCDNCSIQAFPCQLFTKGHIARLSLNYNSIKAFDCGETNNNVLELVMTHNSLQEIPCKTYFYSMQIIDVSSNNISTLPKACKMLSGSADMLAISFHYNNITVLHFNTFCTVGSPETIRYIGFAYNNINTIDTSESPIHKCFEPGAMIVLACNKLSTLDSWPMVLSQNKSITIDFSLNNLSAFTSSVGNSLHASKYGSVFIMQGNQIKYFMDVFNGWNVIVNTTENLNTVLKNAYFDLGHNPLTCDCVDYEVYRYIQTLKSGQYKNLRCQEPLFLRQQNPRHIPLWNFVCDVDVNCPDGCTCIKVPHFQTINISCLDYNQTDLPKVVPDLPKPDYEYKINISHQNLHEITFRPYLLKASEIRLSHNYLTDIKLNSSEAFPMLKVLFIDNNRLQRLPESVAGLTNNTAVDIRLGGNPWVCDCQSLAMKTWIMQNHYIVSDIDTIRCHSPPHVVGVKVIDIERSKVCPNNTTMYIVAAISSAAFVFIVYLFIVDKLKYANWRPVGSDECDGENKEFDIFMCACSEDDDADYVENFLIPELERRDFRVLYHREHFHPGKPIHVNMTEALEKSKRTLVFFSNRFNESGYSMFEFHSAYDLDIRNNTRRLITIKDTDLDMTKLDISERHYFQTHTYLDRNDVKFWTLLENVLPKRRLGAQIRPEGT